MRRAAAARQRSHDSTQAQQAGQPQKTDTVIHEYNSRFVLQKQVAASLVALIANAAADFIGCPQLASVVFAQFVSILLIVMARRVGYRSTRLIVPRRTERAKKTTGVASKFRTIIW